MECAGNRHDQPFDVRSLGARDVRPSPVRDANQGKEGEEPQDDKEGDEVARGQEVRPGREEGEVDLVPAEHKGGVYDA